MDPNNNAEWEIIGKEALLEDMNFSIPIKMTEHNNLPSFGRHNLLYLYIEGILTGSSPESPGILKLSNLGKDLIEFAISKNCRINPYWAIAVAFPTGEENFNAIGESLKILDDIEKMLMCGVFLILISEDIPEAWRIINERRTRILRDGLAQGH